MKVEVKATKKSNIIVLMGAEPDFQTASPHQPNSSQNSQPVSTNKNCLLCVPYVDKFGLTPSPCFANGAISG